MLVACLAAGSQASDLDFARQELERASRSRLSRLPNEQRQTLNLVERYLNQKKAQKKASSTVPAPALQELGNEPVPDSHIPAPRPDKDLLVSYSLTPQDCAQMLAGVTARKHDKDAILMAQQQLIELGFSLDVDGILGTETKATLTQFCENAQFALSSQLLDMLRNHLAIYKRYPDWVQILASAGFGGWALRQYDHEEIGKTRQLGNSTEVIALLDRYKLRKATTPVLRANDFLVSYALTKDDFKQFRSIGDIFKLTEKLQGETYAGKAEFDAALEKAFSEVAEPKRYMQLVREYVQQQSGLMLSEKSFENLKVKNIPDYILQAIQGLKDLNYPDTEINGALEPIIDDLAAQARKFKPEDVVKLAETWPSGTRLTDESLKKFSETQKKDDPIAAIILGKLQKIKKVEYQNSKAMLWAVKNAIKQVVDGINNVVPAIIGEAEETTSYSLSEDSMQKINERMKDFTVPEIYLEMLGDLQDVNYPDPDLFWLATKAKVSMAGSNDVLRNLIFGVIGKHRANKVDESLLGKLKDAKLSPAVIAQIGTLRDRQFDNTKALEDEVDSLFMQLGEQYDAYRPLLIAQSRKEHPFDKSRKIQWSGGACNCVHDRLEGDVYGFYPYWMAGEKQTIDFSVVTRIGYYGLSFDDKGNIANASRWSGLDTGFIREAQTYGAKVDLVVYRNDWKTWNQSSAEEKAVAFENLAANIAGLVNIPLTDFSSRAKPYISMGASPAPIMGDGVTLHFDGYPQDKAAVDAFNVFIRALRNRFKEQGRQYSVNIMFRSSEMGKGIYDYHKLVGLMDAIKGSDKKLNSRFLVLLQEPTTADKKRLRVNIENGLHGTDRMKLLRNVVMVLTFDGHNDSQLKDDVIYAKDNFGGVGFWPQPAALADSAGESAISLALHENYLNHANADISLKPAVCGFICPNRWAFRLAWEFFIFALVACIILYFRTCEYRNFLEKYFLHIVVGVVVPAFLLGMALLTCDPAWAEISRGNGLLVLVVVTVIAYSVWNYRDKQKDANLP